MPYMTNEDAFAHLCPFQVNEHGELGHCEGDQCMAWRPALDDWGHPMAERRADPWTCDVCHGAGKVIPPQSEESQELIECENCDGLGHGEHTWQSVGYCGLVGDPNPARPVTPPKERKA